MRRLTLALVALAALGASPAAGTFTGSIYYTNYSDHHVRRLDAQSGVAGGVTDLAALPGADGLMFDPSNPNRLLVGGQLTGDVYTLATTGGAYGFLNTTPITNGAFHLAYLNPSTILASSQEGPQMNGLGLVDLGTGTVDNRLITGTLQGRVSGVKVRELAMRARFPSELVMTPSGATARAEQTVYITDSPNTALGGRLYTVNLTTNVATLVNVAGNGSAVSHDLHSLWFDRLTGHLFAGGAKHIEEIDLDAIGGPALLRSWDLTSLIPEPGDVGQGHIDQISSDDEGNLFAASNSGEIIYLDLAGAATPTLFARAPDIAVDDIVVGPSTVPEPASLLLAGLGLAGLALRKPRV